MESTLLVTPAGIEARLAWDPAVTVHDRIRILARELVAERLGMDAAKVRLDREAPFQFGHHTQLFATVDDAEVPLLIKTATFHSASVVAVSESGMHVGLDIRDAHPDEDTMFEMRRHSHLWENSTEETIVHHWTRVQAVLQADARGTRVHPEHVRLDARLDRGWVPDRKDFYRIVDISRGGFVITLAYSTAPAETDRPSRP